MAETIGVRDFAERIGVGYHQALEIVKSANRPPGFYVGRNYRVRVDGIDAWFDAVCKTGRQPVRF